MECGQTMQLKTCGAPWLPLRLRDMPYMRETSPHDSAVPSLFLCHNISKSAKGSRQSHTAFLTFTEWWLWLQSETVTGLGAASRSAPVVGT